MESKGKRDAEKNVREARIEGAYHDVVFTRMSSAQLLLLSRFFRIVISSGQQNTIALSTGDNSSAVASMRNVQPATPLNCKQSARARPPKRFAPRLHHVRGQPRIQRHKRSRNCIFDCCSRCVGGELHELCIDSGGEGAGDVFSNVGTPVPVKHAQETRLKRGCEQRKMADHGWHTLVKLLEATMNRSSMGSFEASQAVGGR